MVAYLSPGAISIRMALPDALKPAAVTLAERRGVEYVKDQAFRRVGV
jgi:hypothetical protein